MDLGLWVPAIVLALFLGGCLGSGAFLTTDPKKASLRRRLAASLLLGTGITSLILLIEYVVYIAPTS